jgi:hypothetical protein
MAPPTDASVLWAAMRAAMAVHVAVEPVNGYGLATPLPVLFPSSNVTVFPRIAADEAEKTDPPVTVSEVEQTIVVTRAGLSFANHLVMAPVALPPPVSSRPAHILHPRSASTVSSTQSCLFRIDVDASLMWKILFVSTLIIPS